MSNQKDTMDWHLRYKLETGYDLPYDVREEHYVRWLEEKAKKYFERVKLMSRPVCEGDYVIVPERVREDQLRSMKKVYIIGLVKGVTKDVAFVEYYSPTMAKTEERSFRLDDLYRCEIKLS